MDKPLTAAEQYRAGKWDIDTGYDPLLRPDGTVLTTLTEPEDRQWYRDLAPVVDELNRLADELRALREQNAALAEQVIQARAGEQVYVDLVEQNAKLVAALKQIVKAKTDVYPRHNWVGLVSHMKAIAGAALASVKGGGAS